jgi:hypothetical protein
MPPLRVRYRVLGLSGFESSGPPPTASISITSTGVITRSEPPSVGRRARYDAEPTSIDGLALPQSSTCYSIDWHLTV